MSRLNIFSMLFAKIASGGELMAFVREADHFLDLLRFRLQRFRLCECGGVSGRQLELRIFPGVHAVGGLKWGTSTVFFRHHIWKHMMVGWLVVFYVDYCWFTFQGLLLTLSPKILVDFPSVKRCMMIPACQVDNLFVFQLVFKAYATPEGLHIERALFWGISAAILLRLAFFGLGTSLLAMGFFAKLAFGLLLIYSGIKAIKCFFFENRG